MWPSSWSLTTYDRTFDHTSTGSGLSGCGWGNKGSKTKLPGVRASGLGRRKIAGDSVYVLAMLIICVSEPNLVLRGLSSFGVGGLVREKIGSKSESDWGKMERKVETSRVSKDVVLAARTADGDGGSWLRNEAPGPGRSACSRITRPRDLEPIIAVGQPQAVTRQRVGGPSESTRLPPPAALAHMRRNNRDGENLKLALAARIP